MNRTSSALALVLVGLALTAGGYRTGVHTTNNAWKARQADAERAVNAKYVRDVEKGIKAATAAATEKQALKDRHDDLDRRFKRLRKTLPLVVVPPPAAAECGADTEPAQERGPVPAGPELSVGAVWMWNSALAGHADVPPHSCGAVGPDGKPDPACAAGAGIHLDEAWDNHAENAKRASRNKASCERLMDFLRERAQ